MGLETRRIDNDIVYPIVSKIGVFMFRLSRGCYDKFHRCPGWAGGGSRYGKVERCNNGHITVNYESFLWKFRFWQCDCCNVVVWPYATRYLSIFWLRYEVKWWFRNKMYDRKYK